MNMERRLKKLNGLQPVYIDVDKNPVSDLEPLQEMIEDLENDIKQVEVFTMEDTPVTSAHRAVGIDIGTGFISCAEILKLNNVKTIISTIIVLNLWTWVRVY